MGICKSKISYSCDKNLIYRINHSCDKKFIYNIKHSYGCLQIYVESKKLNIDILIYLLYNYNYSINKLLAIYNPIIFNIGKIKYINKDHESLFFTLPGMTLNKLYYNDNLVFTKTLEYIEYYDINYYNNLRKIKKNTFYRINYIWSKNLYVRMHLLKFYIFKIQYKNYDFDTINLIKHFRRNKLCKTTYYCRI